MKPGPKRGQGKFQPSTGYRLSDTLKFTLNQNNLQLSPNAHKLSDPPIFQRAQRILSSIPVANRLYNSFENSNMNNSPQSSNPINKVILNDHHNGPKRRNFDGPNPMHN